MQRRAAAIYLVFFLVVGAASYAYIGVAQQQKPTVSVDGEAYTEGDQFTVDGRTYTATDVSVEEDEGENVSVGTLEWTNDSARYTAALENDSTVPPLAVGWDGQSNRHVATLSDGASVTYEGAPHAVVLNESTASSGTFLLQNDANASDTTEFAAGDTLVYRGNETTVTEVTAEGATLVWGDPYRVHIANVTDPDEFTLRRDPNVTAVLAADPAVENETVTRSNGREYVVYAENGTTRPLSSYLPSAESRTFAEGDTLVYRGNETTVGNVSASEAPLLWSGERTNTVELTHGENVTLNGETRLAFFPGDGQVKLTRDFQGYQDGLARQGYFHERINGFWGISIISFLAALLLGSMAYLPVKG